MQTANEIIINVQELEPQLRHATIFRVFDELADGESLIIHNNHDPVPVYYQLRQIRGDVFTWVYLQQGPDWWDVRVTKKANTAIINTGNEIIVNVAEIEPQRKHATIFEVFDNLDAGGRMIIHNDHDPKPIYYQLLSQRGEIFTWEYLQEGPEWWDILITIKGAEACEVLGAKEGEPIVDVPSLEPRLKHATIFEVFDTLQAGESMIIHNDHDPKPVYYQLKSERGDIFTWEYLQQGPEWWDIRVAKRAVENEETIGEIAAKDLRKAEVFKQFGIDFCCGGKKTVRAVCAEKGIDFAAVQLALQETEKTVTTGNTNYNDWNVDFLVDYVINTHHNYCRKYLPEIKAYALKVASVHGGHHPELADIKDLVLEVYEELMEHMVEEEQVVFPVVKQIVAAKNAGTKVQIAGGKSFAAMVLEMEDDHDGVGRAMEKIRELSSNYTVPADGCTSYSLLFKMLEEFESDLFIHIHLENNIMFPKAIEMEKSIA
jgi:regulator of cell morphogenesis and NO signaling